MKPFLRQQLAKYKDRQGELEFLLSREDIMKDMEQFLKLSREHTDVAAVAGRWTRYQQRENDLAGAQEMRADPDMAEMADKLADANVMIKARLGRASCQPAYKDLAWTVIPKMIKLSIKTMISLAKVMVNISA